MRLWVTPLILIFAALIAILSAVYGCAAGPEQAPTGLTNAQGTPFAVTFALASYTPEFSAKVAAQLRAAPPELAAFVVDAEKLRCAIKPQMAVCADLLK